MSKRISPHQALEHDAHSYLTIRSTQPVEKRHSKLNIALNFFRPQSEDRSIISLERCSDRVLRTTGRIPSRHHCDADGRVWTGGPVRK